MKPLVISENFRALFYAPFYAAHATGAYAAAGLDVTLRASPSPAATAAAIRSGEADLMWGGPLRVIYAQVDDPGAELVCFCDVVSKDPFFIIGREARPDFTLADLAGVRMGTVSEVPTPWICLAQDLRAAGMDPDTLNRIPDRSMADNAIALARGELDAMQVFQPHAEIALRSGVGHLWYAQASRGPTAYTMLVTRRQTLQARRAELQLVVQAMARTLRWMHETKPMEIARVLQEYFPLVPLLLIAGAIKRYQELGLWSAHPLPNRAGFQWLHDAMRASGTLARDVPYEACVDESLARAVQP